MPRKTIPTIHLLTMAKSLEAQNETASVMFANVTTLIDICRDAGTFNFGPGNKLLEKVETSIENFRAAFWPDEGEG